MINRAGIFRLFSSSRTSPAAAPKENIESLENYWERGMNWYDIYNKRLSLKAYRTITPFLNLEKAKKVLEIGGGTGLGAEILLKQMSPSGSYVLTDHIECFLKIARSKNLPNTEVINVVPSSLPFPGESFDRFVALATIEELETTIKVLNEAYRVLQPGGIIAASVSGKREADNYRLICERIRQKFGIESPLKFRSDLKNTGMVKKMFGDAGFHKTFMFSENIYYKSNNVEELKKFFLQEPTIAEQEPEKFKKIEQFVEKQLINLLHKEESPLGTEFLMIIGFKN